MSRHPFQSYHDSDDNAFISSIPSWSASLGSDTWIAPHSQAVPRDIPRSDEDMPWDERSFVADIIDQTTICIDFDRGCLHSLDEQLLLNPREAFADVCWTTAVSDSVDRAETPTQLAIDTCRYRVVHRQSSQDSDDSDDDPSTPVFEKVEDDGDLKLSDIYTDFYSHTPFIDAMYEEEEEEEVEERSFIDKVPSFSTPNPQEAVNYFPMMPIRHSRTKLPARFVTFCAKFPSRFKGGN
ncbi:hypothetical protein C8J56DRAFT_1046859 [Mycena floridula]|nr:hypothetical protein C8J56DRAFT_1046859 [Mycena floridula]